MAKRSHRVLPIIFSIVVLDLIGIGILIPVIPELLANPNSHIYILGADTPVSYGYIILGILIGALPLAQFFATPILGELSDIYGRRKILAISIAGTCISYLLFAYGIMIHSLTLLFISRILDGFTGGNISVAQATMADITPEQDRAKNFGLIGAAYGLGFIAGPIIGGILSDNTISDWFGAITPFMIAAMLAALNCIAVIAFLPETHKAENRKQRPSWLMAIRHIVSAYAIKKLRFIFASNFLFQAGFSFFATFLSVYLIYRFGFLEKDIGLYLAYGGIWIAFAQGVVARYISARYDDVSILRWSLFIGSLTILSFYFPRSILGLMLIVPLFSIANGLAMAHLPALVSKLSPASIQGEILGINMSVQSLAHAIPPILSGFLAATLAPETPVYVGGAIIMLAWIVFLGVKRKHLE